MANGISKSAASAKAAGVSIDELVGAVAAIGTTTRESGNVIGNSLKTIYARIATFPKSEEILGQAGVAYRDMEGNLRPVGDMLADLAGNWQNLSKEQQLNTAKVLAGGYQYNRFIAYMQNFSIAQDATTTSMNSQGSAMRENEKYMDSLGARIARMQTAWQTLSLAFGDAVITDSIIALTSGLAGLLNLLTPIIKNVGALPVVLGTVATAVYFTSAAFQAWILNMARAVKSIFTVGAAATGAAGSIGATGAAAAGASVGVKALTFSLRGLMIATGIGAAFAAAGWIIEKVIGLFGQASDAVDSFADSEEKLSQTSNEMDSILNLSKSYKELYGKVDKTAQEKAKLADVEAQLNSQFGIATTTIDGQALSYTDIQKEIQKTIDLKKEELKLENQKVQAEYQKESGDAVAKAKELKETYAERRKAYEEAVKAKEEFDAQIKSGEAEKRAQSALALNPNDANSSEEIKKFVEKQAREYSQAVNDALSEMNTADNDIQVQVGKRATAFRAMFSNQVDIFASQGAEVTDSMRQFFDAYATTAAESSMSDADFESTIKDVFETLNNMGPKTVTQFGQTITVASASIDDFVNEINRLTGISMSTEQIQLLNQALARTGYIAQTGGIDPAIEGFEQIDAAAGEAAISMENYGDKFEELTNYIKPLNQVIYSMVEGQKLTSEEISNLIVKYPELANAVHETSEGWTVEVDAVEKLRDTRTKMFKDSIEQEKSRTLATVNGVLKNVQAMGLEVQQVNNLKDARVQLAEITEELNNMDKEDEKKKLMDSIRPEGMNELWGFGAIPPELQKQMDAIDSAKEDRRKKLEELQKGAIGSIDEFENLEKTLNALLGTVEDNTYGTSAQADAQKEAEQAAKDSEKAQKGLNDTYSDTVEILTDLQQSMKKVEDQMDKEARKRERMNKNSKAYRDSLDRENKLIERQQRLLQEGIADPSKLISTTATTSYDSGGDGGTSPQTTQSAGLNSLFAKASELAANDAFDYKQISGKFQGTFEEFLKKGISDCSQYVQEMYEEFLGVTLPRTAAEQAKLGKTITSKKDLEPGDLVFFNTTGKADSHVGIYVGDGKFTQMGTKGLTYQSDLNSDYWSSRYTHGQRIPDVNTKAGPAGYNNIVYDVKIENAYTGQYAKDINNSAEKHGINPQLIAAIIKAESNFNPNAKSHAGARGLMQLMPDTAKGLGVKDSYNPSQNIEGGTTFYAQMLKKYGDPTIALYAYNWGPGNVDKWIKAGSVFSKLPKETQAYANKVLGNFKNNGGSVTGNGVGEGGYKTTYSSATTQDLIDAGEQATDEYNKLSSQYFQNNLSYIDSVIGELEDSYEHFDRLIQNAERNQSNYAESSKKWAKEEESKIENRNKQIDIIRKENTRGAELLRKRKIDPGLYAKQFNENIQRIKDLEQKNIESRTAIFNNQMENFNKEVEGVNRELGKSETLIGQMDSSSETYRKELQRQIKLKKQIVTINKEQMTAIKKRLETEKLTEAEREALNKKYSDLSLENFNTNLDVKDDVGSYTDSRVETYTKEQSRLANALSVSKAKMGLLEENSKEWRAEISKQIDITKKQIDVHSLYVEELKVMLKRTDLTAEQTAKLTDALAEANVETYDLQNTLKELYEQKFNVDSIIEDFKKMLEKQRDLELKSFDERKEAEDKRHENAMDNMQKEYDLFEKTINAQLQAIDRQSDEDTYQDELNKKLEERQKLQVLINNLSRDDSFEARARREDLKTQLDEKDEEITKFRLDRETTLRKQNLSDQLEDRKNTLDQAQKSEDDLNKSNLENIDQEKEAREQYYDDLMDNEQYWYTLKQNLMSEDKNIVLQTINEMQAKYAEFFNYLKSNSGLLTQQGLDNVNYTYNKDSSNLGDYASEVRNSSGNGISAGNGGKSAIAQDWKDYLSNKQRAESLLQQMRDSAKQNKTGTPTQWYNSLLAQFNQLKAANDAIRARNQTFPDYSYEVLKNMKPFSAETGGMTPANMPREGQFLLAHEKELILNKTDTSLMLKAVNAAREYASQNVNGGFLSRLMDKVLPRLQNQQSNAALGGSGDLIIQIENVYTENQDSMNKFYKDIRNEMKKNGQ